MHLHQRFSMASDTKNSSPPPPPAALFEPPTRSFSIPLAATPTWSAKRHPQQIRTPLSQLSTPSTARTSFLTVAPDLYSREELHDYVKQRDSSARSWLEEAPKGRSFATSSVMESPLPTPIGGPYGGSARSSNDAFWSMPSGLSTPTSSAASWQSEIASASSWLEAPSPVESKPRERRSSKESLASYLSSGTSETESTTQPSTGEECLSSASQGDALSEDELLAPLTNAGLDETLNACWLDHEGPIIESYASTLDPPTPPTMRLLSESPPRGRIATPFEFNLPAAPPSTADWLAGTPTSLPAGFSGPPSLDIGAPVLEPWPREPSVGEAEALNDREIRETEEVSTRCPRTIHHGG
jgi:hypothetical protein